MKFNKILLLLALATSSIAVGSEQKKTSEQQSKQYNKQATSDLFKAAIDGDLGLVNRLLSQGAKPTDRDDYGSVLDRALNYGYSAVADRLLQLPEVRQSIKNINKKAFQAWQNKLYDVVGILFHYGADPEAIADRYTTFYEDANEVLQGKVAYILFFLQDKIEMPKEISQLIIAYYAKQPLFTKVQEDNIKYEINGNSAHGLKTCLHKTNIEYVDAKGNTALLIAIQKNRPQIVSELLLQGADLTAQTEKGLDAIGLAEKLRHTEIVTMLKAEKAQRDATAKQLCTIEEITDKETKKEKETKTAKEDTAKKDLNQAAAEKDRLMQELDGYIRANHYKNAISFIEDHNLTHMQDSQGWTPLKLALQYNAKDIGKELIRRRAIVAYETCPSPELQAVYMAWQREVQEEDQQKNNQK